MFLSLELRKIEAMEDEVAPSVMIGDVLAFDGFTILDMSFATK